ncbi:hypothetical protein CAOG_006290 [Capsaspora owczarzaki ATCC 30864]|uniref:Uncharacterized protein n=2 Tax=Capsaspora owczarzaki (strain ATCC 30864) TaxID=595528 RepID=A0A0D2ULC0_CAPO3|nr:hypothetical protein CAOG_006290 [Capsaspora owczarzaki ATCC 30864]
MGSTLHPVSLVYYGAHFSDLITFTPLVIGKFFIRYGVGCAMLFLTRLIFKTLMTRVFTYLLTSSGSLKGVPTVTRDRERPYGGYVIEIPTKFVTYSMVGFMATFAMPAFFRYIGLDN